MGWQHLDGSLADGDEAGHDEPVVEGLLVGLQRGVGLTMAFLRVSLFLPLRQENLLRKFLALLAHGVVIFKCLFRQVRLKEDELAETVEQAFVR